MYNGFTMNSELFMKDNLSSNSKPHRDPSLDRIRVLAILLVVLTHVSAQWLDQASAAFGAPLLFTQLCSIASFAGVSLFVMISGALFLAPSHREKSTSIRFMCQRSLHYLLLYFIWKIFYLLEDALLNPELLAERGIKEQLFLAFFRLTGKYHLWYLPMLVVLLLLVPMIYEGVQRRGVSCLYLIFFVIFAVVLPTAFLFEFPFKYLLMDFRELFDLNYFLGYLGYFLLGHILYEYSRPAASPCAQHRRSSAFRCDHRCRFSVLLWAAVIFSLLLAAYAASVRSAEQGSAYTALASPFTPAVLLLSTALFLTICRSSCSDKTAEAAAALSQSAFGVYLIHPFFLDLADRLGIPSRISNPFLGIPLLLVLLFAVSLGASLLSSRIAFLKKLVS